MVAFKTVSTTRQHTIKLKLEWDWHVQKVCRVYKYRLQVLEVTEWSLWICIYSKFRFINCQKGFCTKQWPFKVRLVRFHTEYYSFCCWLLLYIMYAVAMLVSNLWPATVHQMAIQYSHNEYVYVSRWILIKRTFYIQHNQANSQTWTHVQSSSTCQAEWS